MGSEPQKVLVVGDARGLERETFLAEMKELRKNPLDKAKRKGGYFVSLDGTAHDSEGKAVPIAADDLADVKARRQVLGMPELKEKKAGGKPDLKSGTEDAEGAEEVEDDYSNLSVNELRALAKERGLKTTGSKAELQATLRAG